MRLEQERWDEALEDLELWGSLAFPCPAFFSDWRHNAARAVARLGDVKGALELVESELDAARTFGAARPIGNALLVRGLLESRAKGLESVREAVDVLSPSENKLDLARAEGELGAAIRRLGHPREARDSLTRGLRRAEDCGAAPLAAKAREELVVAGARLPQPRGEAIASLTPSELRVTRMAAEGGTNRAIAESLFVTVKAVEWHLGNAYRKLGIKGRGELSRALESEEVTSQNTQQPRP